LLREALAELPLEYREVLVLRELEELSYLEIASISGRNPDLQPSIALDGSVAILMGAGDWAK
jgi:hypothetical protein